MTRSRTWLSRAGLAVLFTVCVVARTGDGAAQGQLVLKIATPYHPQSPWGRGLDRFARHVQEATRQRIRVRVFYEDSLGPHAAQVARVIDGSLQAYAGPIEGLATQVPALRALETPYLFRSPEDAAKKLARSRERIEALLGEASLRLAQWQHAGFRSRVTLREAPIEAATMTDVLVRGLDVRTTGITLTRQSLAAGVMVYSQRWFEGLPAQTQGLLSRLPDDFDAALARDVIALENDLVSGLKSRGVNVTEANAAEVRAHEQRQAIDAHLQTLTDAARALYRQLSAP